MFDPFKEQNDDDTLSDDFEPGDEEDFDADDDSDLDDEEIFYGEEDEEDYNF